MPIYRARPWPSANRPWARSGFTLLELLAVMALVALVAAMATVRFSTSYRNAQVTTAIAAIHAIDSQLRALTTKHTKPYELRVDLDRHTLRITPLGDAQKNAVREFALPAPLEIAAVRSPREDCHHGQAVVRCDSSGLCETYAIEITTPNGLSRWIVFAGVTGQSLETITEPQIEELFRALAPSRSHVD